MLSLLFACSTDIVGQVDADKEIEDVSEVEQEYVVEEKKKK